MPSAAATEKAFLVTPDNFTRAETDMYLGRFVKEGGLGKIFHNREVASVDNQTVIRLNRDTIYSFGVFDLDASPVTITMPDTRGRFMSLLPIDQDHYARDAIYGTGSYTFTKEQVGTRYLVLAIRTMVDPGKPGDLDQVHALQDAIQVSQKNVGTFEVPPWDQVSQKKVREALLALAATMNGFTNAFGPKDRVDPVRHLVATAAGWGGNPDKDATYLNFAPEKNDGRTAYKVTVEDVPVDGFWSMTVYNAEGYLEPNAAGVYSVNNLSAKKNPDGSITIGFGDPKATNNIPIMPGWNTTVRLYRPRPEILSGQWKFPAPEMSG